MQKRKQAFPHCIVGCSVEVSINLIDGKWKGVILYRLQTEGVLRFNQLRKFMPQVTQKMLTNQLRELERDGLISRKIYPEVPPRVEYALTPLGVSFSPVINALKEWGDHYILLHADNTSEAIADA